MVLKFLENVFGGYFLRYGGILARITGPVTFIAFLPRKDWLFGCNSYLYHCILCCVCELKQLS